MARGRNLLTLFRLIYDGAKYGTTRLPARQGKLFDPDAYPFLEGRPYRSHRQAGERLQPPRVSDGVIYRVLTNLLLLDGEQLSYRALDVEQIGSVYEAMMGYALLVATGPSVGLRPDNVVVNLDELLRTKADDRQKWLREIAGCDLTGQALEQLKLAKKTEDLLIGAWERRFLDLLHTLSPREGCFFSPPTNAAVLDRTTRRVRSPSQSFERPFGPFLKDWASIPGRNKSST